MDGHWAEGPLRRVSLVYPRWVECRCAAAARWPWAAWLADEAAGWWVVSAPATQCAKQAERVAHGTATLRGPGCEGRLGRGDELLSVDLGVGKCTGDSAVLGAENADQQVRRPNALVAAPSGDYKRVLECELA